MVKSLDEPQDTPELALPTAAATSDIVRLPGQKLFGVARPKTSSRYEAAQQSTLVAAAHSTATTGATGAPAESTRVHELLLHAAMNTMIRQPDPGDSPRGKQSERAAICNPASVTEYSILTYCLRLFLTPLRPYPFPAPAPLYHPRYHFSCHFSPAVRHISRPTRLRVPLRTLCRGNRDKDRAARTH